eukprot:2585474-Amphidinium_carterae.2
MRIAEEFVRTDKNARCATREVKVTADDVEEASCPPPFPAIEQLRRHRAAEQVVRLPLLGVRAQRCTDSKMSSRAEYSRFLLIDGPHVACGRSSKTAVHAYSSTSLRVSQAHRNRASLTQS